MRNPFRLQASEHIESDIEFLRMFGPAALDVVELESVWDRVQFIRSAPGGGKTSLLRLLTPSVLRNLVAMRGHSDFRELFQRLKNLGAVTESGVDVVGTLLPCGRTYPDLADLALPDPRARRLFFALLDARLIHSALRARLVAAGLRFPDDLARIVISDAVVSRPPGFLTPCDGFAARQWAADTERQVCAVIDSLDSSTVPMVPGHEAIHSLSVLPAIEIEGESNPQRWVVLMDDVQKLSRSQRAALQEALLDSRGSVGVWVAERLEALSRDELLAPGALAGRDYGNVINLEESWRAAPKRFEAAATGIADRRARLAAESSSDGNLESFTAVVGGAMASRAEDKKINDALAVVSGRVREVAAKETKFAEWVASRDEIEGDARAKLIAWRTLEILIERQKRRRQLAFDFVLPRDELEDKDGAGVRAAAELFVSREFGLPYYHGASRLASLGSFNIQQYLSLAGDLFEESLARSVMRQPANLSADRQEKILSQSRLSRIQDLPTRAHNGRDVLSFIDSVGTFCRWVTYLPNAPYAPGITGVAITMRERDVLLSSPLSDSSTMTRFAAMLSTALAYNLFHAELDRSVKNDRYMVLYLNRVLCPKFDLPLHFGGFRERTLKELTGWLERGYQPPKGEAIDV